MPWTIRWWSELKLGNGITLVQTPKGESTPYWFRVDWGETRTSEDYCYQWSQISGLFLGPIWIQYSTIATGLTTRQPGPWQLGWFYHQKPGISASQASLQWSIWVPIVSWHDQYVNCAVLYTLSPSTCRFAVQPIVVESQSKSHKFHFKFGVIMQRFCKYWSDRLSESGRWKSA